MDDRNLLNLLIARIPNLSSAERVALCLKIDQEGTTVLSKRVLSEMLERPLDRESWTMEGLLTQAERDAAAARRRGMEYVSYASPGYPPLLREIFDPPVVLFFQGTLPDPEQPMAAVVGTRKPSGTAAVQAYDMAKVLSQAKVPVVSGLALGIDAMAHRGSVEGGGPTLAVLGSGLDEVYPASNRMLARRIIEGGGALVSEYPPGTGPMKWHFPARNRIIAGLARGTLIVEAPRSSGALITAQFALEQGRDLWVASAGVSSPLGAGTRKLADEGSKVISSAVSILREWNIPNTDSVGETISEGPVLALSLARSLNIEL